MSGDENTPNDAAIELTDEELDEVAGGFNMRLTFASFRKSTIGFAQETPLGTSGSAQSAFQAETTESALLQFTITDATTKDLEVLGELFGDASALDGSA
ncbi:MAG: CTB family bacteriocin [Aulosira sp. DedQUE10]|nr:CTB family bacteriocin [Aulosira sp. DedQUE10]